MLQSNFRRQVWRPALVRAGLLGHVPEIAPDRWRGTWPAGREEKRSAWSSPASGRSSLTWPRHAEGGLRFHGLRHCYATWLVSAGVRVNIVQGVLGHEQASTTINRYTYTPTDLLHAVRLAFGR